MLHSDPVIDYDEGDSSDSDEDYDRFDAITEGLSSTPFSIETKRPIEKPSLIVIATGDYASLFVETVLLSDEKSEEVGSIILRSETSRAVRSASLYELQQGAAGRALLCCVKQEPKAEQVAAWTHTFTSQFVSKESQKPVILLLGTRARCELRDTESESDQLRRFDTEAFAARRSDAGDVALVRMPHSVGGLAAQLLAFSDCFGIPFSAFWLFTAAESPFVAHVSFAELFAAFRTVFVELRRQSQLQQSAVLAAFALERLALAETGLRVDKASQDFAKKRAISVQTKQQIYS